MTTLDELLAQVRELPPMTREEVEIQRMDWVYGNLAASTNHRPHRSAFRAIWVRRGLAPEVFDAWAAAREWWG